MLDLGLPDRNGLDLKDLRSGGMDVPVVVLSSRLDEAGIVQALELGADDYVTKPFSMNELIARIKVALRHRLQEQGEKPVFKVGELSVDLVRRVVKLGDNEVKLSPREYEILRTLVRHAGRVLTHQALMREVWGGIADVQNCGSRAPAPAEDRAGPGAAPLHPDRDRGRLPAPCAGVSGIRGLRRNAPDRRGGPTG